MKVIKNGGKRAGLKNTVVTLGNFDGIHLGHALILKKVAQRAKSRRLKSVVYTFEPHPLKVVAPHRSPQLILDNADKEAVIKGFGIDYIVFARFTRAFASKHPGEFVEEELVNGLGAREVWVGANFSFGRGRLGTAEYLKGLSKKFGFKVFAVPPRKKGGAVVSSSRVRELIRAGEVKKAASLLGRSYAVKGFVVKGKSLGKKIGFPTANLRITSEILPANGVYACRAAIGKKRYNAAVNIGTAPTLGKKPKTVEAHIVGFKKEIYGASVRLEFIKRLRDEKRFESVDALVAQIKKDIKKVERLA